MSLEADIFKNGSRTYFWSSTFFPKKVRTDVFRLYSFVRVADNFVDEQPAQPKKLLALEKAWLQARDDTKFELLPKDSDTLDQRVIKNIVLVSRKYDFKHSWIEAFFAAMKADIAPKPFSTLDDSLGYVYGSAEVIGLMMARIMGLPEEAYAAAQAQGRAMQWVNFIRDIDEDNQLGRQYFPIKDLREYGLKNLQPETAQQSPEAFASFMELQLRRYKEWQAEVDAGMHYIPKRLRVPLQTAVSMYNWTAEQIANDPMIVFEKKVKPTKQRVLNAAAKSVVRS